MRFSSLGLIVLSLVLIAALSLPGRVQAATRTWTGSLNANWSAAANWQGVALSSGDALLFNDQSVANLTTSNDLADWLVGGVTVIDPTGNATLGGNPFTLGAGGIDMSAATRDLTVSIVPQVGDVGTTGQLTIGADQTWTVPAGRKLTLSALASRLDGNNDPIDDTILMTGGGQVQFIANQVSINWAGTIHLRDVHMLTQHDLGGDPNNSLGSGTFILENARLDLNGNKNQQLMPIDIEVLTDSTVAINRGGNNNTVLYRIDNLTIGDATLTVLPLDTQNTRAFAVNDGLILNGRPTFDIQLSRAAFSVNGSITDPNGLANGFIKTGEGSMSLWGANSPGGSIVVKQGRIDVYSTGAFGGASGQLILDGGNVWTLNNAGLNVDTPVDVYGQSGMLARPRGGNRTGNLHRHGALAMHGAELTLRSHIQWNAGTSRIGFNAADTVFSQGANTFVVDRDGAAAAFRVETGGNWIRQNRATMHVDILTDNTVFRSAPVALAPDGERLPMVTFKDQANPIAFARTDGTDVLPLTTYTALPAAGGDATTAYSLSGDATLSGNSAGFLLKVDATAAGQSLDLGGNALALNYSGGAGAGGLLFTGDDAYSVVNGTVDSQGAELIVHQYNAGGVTLAANLDLGAGGLTKSGPGDLVLTTAQAFPGDLTVNQGAVRLSGVGAVAGGVRLATGAQFDLAGITGDTYSVPVGGGLSGVGTVVLGDKDVLINGTVSPGFSAGTLTFLSTGGDFIVGSTGVLQMEIVGFEEGEFDRIVVDGGDFVAGGTLELVNAFSGTPELGDSVQLFDITGAFSGSFATILNSQLGGDLFWDTSMLLVDGTITVAIPEPASGLLLLLLALAAPRRRGLAARRRQAVAREVPAGL